MNNILYTRGYDNIFYSLNDALTSSSLGLEDSFQLVFFHPKYQFRDGMARIGEEKGAANFARRSPWPMVNILRTNQVRSAQRGIPTGVVYKQNEDRLNEVGTQNLQHMLDSLDWSLLPSISASSKLEQIRLALERAKQLELAEAEEAEMKGNKEKPQNVEIDSIPIPVECPFHETAINHSNVQSSSTSTTLKDLFEKQNDSSKEMSSSDYSNLADEIEKWINSN